jgi:hypothetical protein
MVLSLILVLVWSSQLPSPQGSLSCFSRFATLAEERARIHSLGDSWMLARFSHFQLVSNRQEPPKDPGLPCFSYLASFVAGEQTGFTLSEAALLRWLLALLKFSSSQVTGSQQASQSPVGLLAARYATSHVVSLPLPDPFFSSFFFLLEPQKKPSTHSGQTLWKS